MEVGVGVLGLVGGGSGSLKGWGCVDQASVECKLFRPVQRLVLGTVVPPDLQCGLKGEGQEAFLFLKSRVMDGGTSGGFMAIAPRRRVGQDGRPG